YTSLSHSPCDCSGDSRDLHSLPTRRSSDLVDVLVGRQQAVGDRVGRTQELGIAAGDLVLDLGAVAEGDVGVLARAERGAQHVARSEEHTSELQSRENLVCRLLLEKKKSR